jgi:Ca2+-binding RTX toxin-like protein
VASVLRISAVLATGLAALLAPAAALGGTVDYSSVNVLQYTAAAGEANRLVLSVEGNRMVFTEETGVLIGESAGAAADCDGQGTPVLKCKLDHSVMSPVYAVSVVLGDMDDRATAAFPADSTLSVGFNGEAGADTLDGSGAASGSLSGGAGPDKLTASRVDSTLSGGPEGDEEIGGPAGSRNNFFQGNAPDGADQLRGGAGLDIVEYEDRSARIVATADGVADDGEGGEGDNIAPAVEGLQGGTADDDLTASASVNGALSGYAGRDRLTGGPGDDVLFGGEGDDTLEGNAGDDLAASSDRRNLAVGGGSTADLGADSFAGGPGFDTVDYSSRVAPVSVTLNAQADDGEAGEGDSTGSDVEELIGGAGADTLSGDVDAERYVGGAGADSISPAGGTDDVVAGDGDDTISAQDGTFDRVACGVGSDTAGADSVDALDQCENATVAPPPILPAADVTPPKIAITKLNRKPRFKRLAAKGVTFRLGADEAASFVTELQGTARRVTLARVFNVVLVTRPLSQSAAVRSVKLKPKRALLGKRRKLTLRLRITAKDAAGNQRVANRTIRVRR